MTIQECYAAIGGDYESVLGRFRKEDRILRFALMFLTDPSFAELCQSLEQKNYPEAFRAAHTLKGVTQNLGFDQLYAGAYDMTEALRGGEPQGNVADILVRMKQEYEQTVAALLTLQAEGSVAISAQ
jgi:HPt (histidine-containing phosphotransfer) domain-containing protein